MTDAVAIALITGSTTVIGGLVTVLGARLSRTLKQVHTLVNSNMGAQLKLNATVTHRLAVLTGDPVDQEAATLSRKLLDEHEAKQAVVDSTTK